MEESRIDDPSSGSCDHEAQLRRAEKLATVGLLASGVAHDFANILTTIVGRAEMARSELTTTSAAHPHLQTIIDAANRARGLARQIISFSGRGTHQREPVQVQLVLWEALELLRATLPTNIEILENIDFKCRTIQADPTQIYQVVMNLATNAYQAMCRSGGVLEVSLDMVRVQAEHLQPGDKLYNNVYARLTISDTGHGMNEGTMARIFEPFFTTKDGESGTGLGLSVARTIVEAHGGEVTVHSVRGKGTTFQVYLPIGDAQDAHESSLAVESRGDEHVLVLDEDEDLARMQQAMLERLGYEVTARTDTLSALRDLQLHPNGFDVVVAQRGMPLLQGGRQAPRPPAVPVIVTSGQRERHSLHEKTPSLFDCVLRPVIGRDLSSAIRRVLDRKGA